jgi:hypothetical protein
MKKKDYDQVELLQIDSTVVTKWMMRRAEPDTRKRSRSTASGKVVVRRGGMMSLPESPSLRLPPLGEKTRCHESKVGKLNIVTGLLLTYLASRWGVSHHFT